MNLQSGKTCQIIFKSFLRFYFFIFLYSVMLKLLKTKIETKTNKKQKNQLKKNIL